MKLDKISASLRRKNIANDSAKPVNSFIRWNNTTRVYDLVIEIYDSRSGEKFEMIGTKNEWINLTGKMMEALAKFGEREP